ncbi:MULTISPECIES: acyl-CoA dehydrogenase family protein [unclassified Nonomuraea]|uniref:acyl-CoA dehydrogenase family protein n=1 Tax=unclassified Nonomuraea TaxID=2593643 RepID=UPI0013776958|nr:MULTISPECIES: acyl-CoA dehydrogenase family protein [unclassified Nonomuraea]NBE95026.1 acyl-CoA dehydrogenase [Nonomuraea sp. K271]
MDFGLSEEQVAMGGAVRRWLDRHLGLARVAEYADTPSAGFDAGLRRAAADLNWLGVTAAPSDGGLGLGLLDLAVVAEALGAGLAPAGVGTAMAAGDILATSIDPEQRRRWLAPMVAGELIGAAALRAPGGSWDRDGIAVAATRDGLLSGDAGIVGHAQEADILLVAATSASGPAVFVVAAGHPGVSIRAVEPVDPTMRAARVTLTQVPAEPLSWAHDGVFERIVQRLTVLVSADLVGAAGTAMRITLDHLRGRRQFGRAIGSFQAIQHELAELHVAWTTISGALWYTAHAHDTGRDDAVLMTSVVKSRAADLARRMSAAMVQFHGAIGFTWEHSAHLFFKRLHRDAYDFGDDGWHDSIVATAAIGPGTHPALSLPGGAP